MRLSAHSVAVKLSWTAGSSRATHGRTPATSTLRRKTATACTKKALGGGVIIPTVSIYSTRLNHTPVALVLCLNIKQSTVALVQVLLWCPLHR